MIILCGKVTHSNFERVYLWNGKDYSRFWPNTESRMIFDLIRIENQCLFKINWMKNGIVTLNNWKWLNDLYFWLANFTVLLVDWENVVEVNKCTLKVNVLICK